MSSKRLPQVNQVVKKELSQIILREFDFAPSIFVTLTRVETSADLKQSKIYISVMPESQFDSVLKILNSQIYQIQHILNRRLNMRPIPRICFIKEKETSKAGKIEEILEGLKKDEK